MPVCSFSQFQTRFRISNPLALNSVATSERKSRPSPHCAKSRLRVPRTAKLAGFDDYQRQHTNQPFSPGSLRSKVDFEPHGPLALYTLANSVGIRLLGELWIFQTINLASSNRQVRSPQRRSLKQERVIQHSSKGKCQSPYIPKL